MTPPSDDLPSPPRTVLDQTGRTVRIERIDPDRTDDLAEMYAAFDPDDRAQGIPPRDPDELTDWLESILTDDAHHIVASADGHIVGHAMLVPDSSGAYELAVFVQRDDQRVGIGKALVRSLLGLAREAGIERVWLTVERWNESARELYSDAGFDVTDSQRFQLEMAQTLTGTD